MWNFNNGQIIRQMVKDNDLEVSGIEYVEMVNEGAIRQIAFTKKYQFQGTNKYVAVVGWDRKITIFLDDGDNFESEPVRILNGAGTSVIKG